MNIKCIQDADIRGKKILVRVDFNVSINKEWHVQSEYKIRAAKETIDYLIARGATHIALLTHFKRPQESNDMMQFSLRRLVPEIQRIINQKIYFVPDCVGEFVSQETKKRTQNNEVYVMLLENVRFYNEEKKDDHIFAQKLAESFDVYVNDAFAVTHRKHASVHAITKYINAYAGIWLQKEIMHLEQIKHKPQQPAIAIIGGAKIETKIPMITELCESYSTILVGGKTAVDAQRKKYTFDDKVILPQDYAYNTYDIGPETIALFCKKIASAHTIVWNGPMGKIEEDKYKIGTKALIDAILKNEHCFCLIGGGESVQMLEEYNVLDRVSFVSTGGGAMLAFIGNESMPALEVLQSK